MRLWHSALVAERPGGERADYDHGFGEQAGRSLPGLGCIRPEPSVAPRSGPFPGQVSPQDHQGSRFRWSTAVRIVYHQQTKNLLVSYSPKKLGFF